MSIQKWYFSILISRSLFSSTVAFFRQSMIEVMRCGTDRNENLPISEGHHQNFQIETNQSTEGGGMLKEMRHQRSGRTHGTCDVSPMVCPFSWVEVVKPKEYFSLLFEEKVKSEITQKPCLLTRCKFFNSHENICKLMASE
jgi:hypothetical protein